MTLNRDLSNLWLRTGGNGKTYDHIVTARGELLFDSPDRFHYLAQKGNAIYLVEEVLTQK